MIRNFICLIFVISFINFFGQKENKLNSETINWLNRIDSCINIKPGEKIADIGSGSLYNLAILASRHPEANFYATDIKWNYRFSKKRKIKKICEKYAITNNHNIYTSKAGYTNTKLKSNNFDKVLLLNTFHDLSEIDLVLNDIKRILKTDGCLIIEEPFQEHESNFKFKECYRPFFTEEFFKDFLSKLTIQIITESIVNKPLPEEKYFIRKQFKCKFY